MSNYRCSLIMQECNKCSGSWNLGLHVQKLVFECRTGCCYSACIGVYGSVVCPLPGSHSNRQVLLGGTIVNTLLSQLQYRFSNQLFQELVLSVCINILNFLLSKWPHLQSQQEWVCIHYSYNYDNVLYMPFQSHNHWFPFSHTITGSLSVTQ